jgi:TolB-like protein
MSIDLAREAPFKLADVEVRPSTREVASAHRREIIEPRVMQVLVALGRRCGEVVSRDELTASCWGGRVVGEDAISRCIQAIRKLADTHGGFSVTTIARVGYRLEGAQAQDVDVDAPREPDLRPSQPSIAVMPFANFSDDAGQLYFADGMVVEIVTALSRFQSLFVIASGSGLSYRGTDKPRQAIARELGVRYLLEGSVRREDERVRIAVQLVDATEGAQVWAERFDGVLEDVFALQDDVANAVASRIEPTIHAVETRRAAARPTQDLRAYDLYLRGLHAYQRMNVPSMQEAVGFLDEAIAQDPTYAVALATAAACRADLMNLQGRQPDEDVRIALDYRARALQSGGEVAEVLAYAGLAGWVLGVGRAASEALTDRALARNGSSATVLMVSGHVRLSRGKKELALRDFQAALRLDPASSWRNMSVYGAGVALLLLHRFEEAIPVLEEARDLVPSLEVTVDGMIASALAHSGRLAEAKALLETLPSDSLSEALKWIDPQDAVLLHAGHALARGEG